MRISLTALRAFEATARLSSMSMAAAELRVGLASISRHVSALQARLGVELLRREGRRVVLTPAGRSYFAEITAAFRTINGATANIAAEGAPAGPKLSIACDRSLAQSWLLPRLAGFSAGIPGLSLELSDASEPGGAADIEIVYRRASVAPAPEEIALCEPPMLAIAAVGLGSNHRTLSGLLRAAPLIHSRNREGWRDWLALAGYKGEVPRGGVVMPDKVMAITAAGGGFGVALACRILAEDELASGRCRVILGNGHVMGRFVALQSQRPAVDPALSGAFIAWLRAEMLASIVARQEADLQPA